MNSKLLVFVILLLPGLNGFCQNPNFHIYLCFGQSNMEGSATIEPQDTIPNNRFLVMQTLDCENLERMKANWYPATPPLSQCYAGLSPADYFGKTMVENLPDSIKIGIINVAVGGCDMRLFDKDIYEDYKSSYVKDWFLEKVKNYGGNPYQHLVDYAKLAQKDGVIKGMLLHQGETNTGDEKWPMYVKKIYNDLLTGLYLQADAVPLLAGELVHKNQDGGCAGMNTIINTLPNIISTAYIISSDGCTDEEDNIHFNSNGCRMLGKRYALKMLSLLQN